MAAGVVLQPECPERLSPERIVELFGPLTAARGILLAVSGGPDSVALMLMAKEWASLLAAAPPVAVATVDHGLRRESWEEAEMVAGFAAALSLPHTILAWCGEKPRSRIQERARDARYALLFQHAYSIGADYLVTAHHADDQAETVLFRLLRGSGIAGLAGMPGTSERHGIVLSRPLLSIPKAELVRFCEARHHPFIRDPANQHPSYARTRIRRLARLFAEEGLDAQALRRLGQRAARANAALERQLEEVVARISAKRNPGNFSAHIEELAGQPEEILLRFLADELKVIGAPKALRLDRLEVVTARLAKSLAAGTPFKTSLGGAIIRFERDYSLLIEKEGERRRGRKGNLRRQLSSVT